MSTAMVSLENAPRDLQGLVQLRRTIIFRLAHTLNMFADETQEAAFNQAPIDQMCQALLAALQNYDTASGGAPASADPAPPAAPAIPAAPVATAPAAIPGAQIALPPAPAAAQSVMPGVVIPPQQQVPPAAPRAPPAAPMGTMPGMPTVVPPQVPPAAIAAPPVTAPVAPVVTAPQIPAAAPVAAPMPPPITMPAAAPQQPVRAPTTKAAPTAVVPAPAAPAPAPATPAPQIAVPGLPAAEPTAAAVAAGGPQLMTLMQAVAGSLKQLAETSQQTQQWLEQQQGAQGQLLSTILLVQLALAEQANIDAAALGKFINQMDPNAVANFLNALSEGEGK